MATCVIHFYHFIQFSNSEQVIFLGLIQRLHLKVYFLPKTEAKLMPAGLKTHSSDVLA